MPCVTKQKWLATVKIEIDVGKTARCRVYSLVVRWCVQRPLRQVENAIQGSLEDFFVQANFDKVRQIGDTRLFPVSDLSFSFW